ncbi:MAG TPA: hypothetical protein VHE36_12705 [Sphingomicrobium sp.]|nr:hypothetical protein [Sphingomicrobium sp.]
MIRFRFPLAALACLLIAAPAAEAKRHHQAPAGPSNNIIVKLLNDHYLGDDPINYPTTKYTFTVHKVSRGAARLGNHWADGTPPHTKTTVFPVHATSTRTMEYDGSRTVTDYDAKYVFFKDEFHEWTFTIKSEHSTISH